ncbi:hypothetical protein V6N12_070716 [Hibiscus sabdariffa]|uniref:Oligopeptide transporter 4 n=1 Tax=Hibiscus sabdariffa TaxID=183260 RepID=A0ABR2FHL7_9ROSI
MSSLEIEQTSVDDGAAVQAADEDDVSPIEEVRLTVSNDDDSTLPVWTFRMWFIIIGVFSCVLLSFLNTFLSYRSVPLQVTMISIQVASLPVGKFMAKVLPITKFKIPVGNREFTLNPGLFNVKEHVLISIFANAGAGFGGGTAYAISIVDVNIIRAFYHIKINFLASWILVITTQVLGRKFVVEPAAMWWPSSLVQLLLVFISRLFVPDIANHFLGLLGISQVNNNPSNWIGNARDRPWIRRTRLVCHRILPRKPSGPPFFARVNIFVGFALFMYVVLPISYWGLNLYDARTFPIFSSHLFNNNGEQYNISGIVSPNSKWKCQLMSSTDV